VDLSLSISIEPGDADDADIACLRLFYTTCPAALADTMAEGTKGWDGVSTWSDEQWEKKCSKIIGSYKKKVEKKLLVLRIIRKEQERGTLVDDKVEERRAELDAMGTKKRSKLVASLGLSASVQDEEQGEQGGEEALLSLRELMYGEIAAKYAVDPREMQQGAEATSSSDEGEDEDEEEVDDGIGRYLLR
jgi:hypothetical protein